MLHDYHGLTQWREVKNIVLNIIIWYITRKKLTVKKQRNKTQQGLCSWKIINDRLVLCKADYFLITACLNVFPLIPQKSANGYFFVSIKEWDLIPFICLLLCLCCGLPLKQPSSCYHLGYGHYKWSFSFQKPRRHFQNKTLNKTCTVLTLTVTKHRSFPKCYINVMYLPGTLRCVTVRTSGFT